MERRTFLNPYMLIKLKQFSQFIITWTKKRDAQIKKPIVHEESVVCMTKCKSKFLFEPLKIFYRGWHWFGELIIGYFSIF